MKRDNPNDRPPIAPPNHAALDHPYRPISQEAIEHARRDEELAWLRRERPRYLALVRELAAMFPACGCPGGCIHARAAALDVDSCSNEARVGVGKNGGRTR